MQSSHSREALFGPAKAACQNLGSRRVSNKSLSLESYQSTISLNNDPGAISGNFINSTKKGSGFLTQPNIVCFASRQSTNDWGFYSHHCDQQGTWLLSEVRDLHPVPMPAGLWEWQMSHQCILGRHAHDRAWRQVQYQYTANKDLWAIRKRIMIPDKKEKRS